MTAVSLSPASGSIQAHDDSIDTYRGLISPPKFESKREDSDGDENVKSLGHVYYQTNEHSPLLSQSAAALSNRYCILIGIGGSLAGILQHWCIASLCGDAIG